MKLYFPFALFCIISAYAMDSTHETEQANSCYKFVLTGGPGVGKSTIINMLQENGYYTRPEVWTTLYEEAKEQGRAVEFSAESSSAEFRQTLMYLQLSYEESLPKNTFAFLDRSAVDVVAFGKLYNISMPKSITDVLHYNRYDLVFFLEPLPADFFNKSEELNCNYQTSLNIHRHLQEFYENTDPAYSLIHVPFADPQTRTALILKSVATWLERNK